MEHKVGIIICVLILIGLHRHVNMFLKYNDDAHRTHAGNSLTKR